MSGVLPGDLGRRHRVGTFLDGLQTGNAEDDDFIADYGRPGAAEVASIAGLAVRLRLLGWLGGTGGTGPLPVTSSAVSDTFRRNRQRNPQEER